MKPANNSLLLAALLGTGLFAVLALALGWLISHPVGLGQLTATPTIILPTPATTYPPGPFVALGPSRLGAVRRLDHWPQLWFSAAVGLGFINPSTDGASLTGEIRAGGSIVLIDLASAAAETIAYTSDLTNPQVSEHYVVWTDEYRIHYFDRKTRQSGVLDLNSKVRRTSLSASVLVWENIVSAGWQIWGHDFSTENTFTVSRSMQAQDPLISGNWVVYTDRTDRLESAMGLHATNISTHEEIVVTHLALSALEPYRSKYYAIDDPWIVWASQAVGENPRLNLYNLGTRKSKAISLPSTCTQNVLPGLPARLVASGGIVLLQDCTPLGYDIQADQFFALPLNDRQKPLVGLGGWAFANGKLVWSDAYSDHTALFTASITTNP